MKVALRVDASARIGIGHVKRCLSLAKALSTVALEPVVLHRVLDLARLVKTMAASAGVEELCLETPAVAMPTSQDHGPVHAEWAGVHWFADAHETIAALAELQPAWLVIDHYSFDARWHDVVRGRLGCRIAAIDDLGDRALGCDLLVDPNLHPDHDAKYAGLLPSGTMALTGPRFALLDPDYARAPRYRFQEKPSSIGIFMGGTDQPNLSATVLAAIDQAGFSGPVEVATTSGNRNLPALRAAIAGRPNSSLTLDLEGLYSFFARHDLQIGAGGGATWERLCIGAPSVLLAFADNHLEVLRPLAAQGMAHVVEAPWTVQTLASAIAALIADPDRRRAYSAAGITRVDGQGAARVAAKMRAMC